MNKKKIEEEKLLRRVQERRDNDPLNFRHVHGTSRKSSGKGGFLDVLGCLGVGIAVVVGLIALLFVAFVIISVVQEGGWG